MIRWMLVFLALCSPALAQRFPERPVTIIVPFAEGGLTETLARGMAEAMSRDLGKPVLVRNVAGAGGSTGVMRVVNAPPDGHVILLGNIRVATAPALYRRPLYDPLRDLEPIGLITSMPMMVVSRLALPAQDFASLIGLIRARGPAVTIAHAGLGSPSYLCAALLRSLAGAPMTFRAYPDNTAAMTGILEGRVDTACQLTTNVVYFLPDNTLRPLAVTTPERLAMAPDVPTAEGALPAMTISVWNGFYAPRGTPAPILNRLAQATRAALADATVRELLSSLTWTPEPDARVTPAAHRALLESEVARWRAILGAAGEYAD